MANLPPPSPLLPLEAALTPLLVVCLPSFPYSGHYCHQIEGRRSSFVAVFPHRPSPSLLLIHHPRYAVWNKEKKMNN